jgi:hypothetical protein
LQVRSFLLNWNHDSFTKISSAQKLRAKKIVSGIGGKYFRTLHVSYRCNGYKQGIVLENEFCNCGIAF